MFGASGNEKKFNNVDTWTRDDFEKLKSSFRRIGNSLSVGLRRVSSCFSAAESSFFRLKLVKKFRRCSCWSGKLEIHDRWMNSCPAWKILEPRWNFLTTSLSAVGSWSVATWWLSQTTFLVSSSQASIELKQTRVTAFALQAPGGRPRVPKGPPRRDPSILPHPQNICHLTTVFYLPIQENKELRSCFAGLSDGYMNACIGVLF